MTTSVPALSCENLLVKRGDRTILRELSFRLGRGELAGIVGPNGAGKSTLLDALLGLVPTESGEISFSGRPLPSLTPLERARQLGLSGREERDPHGLRVEDVVLLGKELASPEDTRSLDDFFRLLDLEALWERTLDALSSGERQRVHWARVLAQNPKILLLDEATTHLDLHHRELAAKRMREFTRSGGSILCVVHELEFAVRHFDRLLVLQGGTLVADGEPSRILTSQLLRDVFELEARIVPFEGQNHLILGGNR